MHEDWGYYITIAFSIAKIEDGRRKYLQTRGRGQTRQDRCAPRARLRRSGDGHDRRPLRLCPIAGISAFWAAKESQTLEMFLESQAHFFVAGTDGVRWDFFSSDPSHVDLIRSHAEQLPGFRIAPTTLRNYLSHFYGQLGRP